MLRFVISRHNWLKAATGKLFVGLTLGETTLTLYMLSPVADASKLAQLAPTGSQALIFIMVIYVEIAEESYRCCYPSR